MLSTTRVPNQEKVWLHLKQEAAADNTEWKDLKQKTKKKFPTEPADGSQPLSDEWVKDAFKLSSNETLKNKPELMARLVKVLANHGPAFKGGPHRQKEAGQTWAGRTHWVTARVELRDDCMTPLYIKQRSMHSHDKAMLSSQLNLWVQQRVIQPCESQWNSALIAVAKKDSSLK